MNYALPVCNLETRKNDKNRTSVIKFNKNTSMNIAPRASRWLKSRCFFMSYHACLGNWGEVGMGGVVKKNKQKPKKKTKKNTTQKNPPQNQSTKNQTPHPTPTPQQTLVSWNLCHPAQQDILTECQGQEQHSEVLSITHPVPVLLLQPHS